jgi:pantoate--beta-alanine ligase
MTRPAILETVTALRAQVRSWREAREAVALVPTMGALHAGHIALVTLARTRGARVVVSIFVNPTQFAPHEDFSKYPRTFEADIAKLAAAGADAVFHPAPAEIYPDGFCTSVALRGPATAGLEDRFRPTHFQGVATVVAKLLLQCLPDVAIFGEKDFQQLAVIRQMARDLDIPVEILGAPTVREADGLAMSSRNTYLSESERAVAPVLHRSMQKAAARIRDGEAIDAALAAARTAVAQAGFELDYLEVRDADSLAEVKGRHRKGLRMLIAARLGRTRLIDNIEV